MMTRETDYTLYVHLSASQTRKRLKGRGFGVRRVEATDRNQSAITHTATGDHLRELQSLFSDVMSSETKNELGTPVENLRNLGTASAAWLHEIGIQTRANLEAAGPAHAYRLIKQNHADANLNLLWAMAAALADVDADRLSEAEKTRLLAEVEG
jgi:hypothetical protein